MRILLLVLAIVVGESLLMAQVSDRMTRSQYFETYKDMAIGEMQRSGVPASITLAQGALESGDGNSRLAKNGNNHFGIKCHNDWNGKRIFEDDDARNECFRKYKSAEESYRDHSDYLRSKTRYASLFDLDVTDYKGWARGLKKAGYATSPSYAESLIRIIEEFDLDKYDRKTEVGRSSRSKSTDHRTNEVSREILERNRVKYLLGREGDTFETLTEELGKLDWELPSYNDVVKPDSIRQGQVVYIQPKRNKAEIGNNQHVVKEDETMYMIAQLYALKLSRLYQLNGMNPGTRPAVGTVLQLRKPAHGIQQKTKSQDPVENFEEGEEIKIELNLE